MILFSNSPSMHSTLLFVAQVCYINTLIGPTIGYVLLSANLEDFRSIAKKIIPSKLAEELYKILTESPMKYRHEKPENVATEYEDEADPGVTDITNHRPDRSRYEQGGDREQTEASNIPNIDEIVEKVKERLNIEYKKPKTMETDKTTEVVEIAKPSKASINLDQNEDDKVPLYDEQETQPTSEYLKQFTDNEKQPKFDVIKSVNNYQKDSNLYKSVSIKKNKKEHDSYEDYVIPKKENIYASEENVKNDKHEVGAILKSQKPTDDINTGVVKPRQILEIPVRDVTDFEAEKVTTKSIKARTARLWFKDIDYDNDAVNNRQKEFRQKDNRQLGNRQNTRKQRIIQKIASGIPTAFPHYKISTPDYYKKLPVVVEKYNVNEPIPERDRERKKFKYIGNPPALINGKVKLIP